MIGDYYRKTVFKMITIAISNQKGGVGKTTIAFNLAKILSKRRKTRVLAVDNDPLGNLTSSLLENSNNYTGNVLNIYDDKPFEPIGISNSLSVLCSNINLAPVAEREFQVIFKLKEGLVKLGSKFDFAIIDSVPSFGHLHLASLSAADYVLIPVKPDPYALTGMEGLLKTIEKTKKYFKSDLQLLGIVINQVDGRNPVIEREMETALREAYGKLVLKTKINKRIKVVESPTFQKAIIDYDSKGLAAKEFKAMTGEILKRIKYVHIQK
jgi:chromosome partitioning protein